LEAGDRRRDEVITMSPQGRLPVVAISGSSIPGAYAVPPASTPSAPQTMAAATFPALEAREGGCPMSPAVAPASVHDATSGVGQLSVGTGGPTNIFDNLLSALRDLQAAITQFAQRLRGGAAGLPPTSALGGGSHAPQKFVAPPTPNLTSDAGSPVQGSGVVPTSATTRASAIPSLDPGQTEALRLARGQITYRQIAVTGGATGTVINAPNPAAGVRVELYALRDFRKGAHTTQVLEPVTGSITVPAGETVKFVTRISASEPGDQSISVAGSRIDVHVGTQAIDALPMMAWVNEANASQNGASVSNVASVLSHFGVAATGNSGVAVTSAANRSPVQYYSVAYAAANRTSPAAAAQQIIAAERQAQAANPGSKFWVQVSDEQDTSASQVAGTVEWINELKQHLAAGGSQAKLFVAAQAKPANLAYASVVDGWATTQTAAGQTRDTSIAQIKQASAGYGRSIELMEYPGNAFFDAGTVGGAAISTASAALDGASSWFLYSANNLDTLERGTGDEGKGDIGGLVAFDGNRVLPTIALIEAELGANLGSAARAVGGAAVAGSSAAQVATTSNRLDAYQHSGSSVDLRAWETQIGALIP
ncbi:MAG: hypothetical protein JWN41_161, partial [Thermoleophilia bacterium]|nr:hypothetical protein [Thermoleophilia bacterium]